MKKVNNLWTKLLCAVLVLCGLLCCAGAAGAEGDCAHTFADGACTACGVTGGYCGASANEGGEQSVIWTLADNHLVISGTGAMADFYYSDRTPWYNECETITDVTIGNGVTRIGDYAFHYYFQSLTEITIPASVESIGYQAFGYSTVSSVTFAPNSRLTTIDGYAFSYLDSLKQITLPASVESIGDGAFDFCGALKTVTFAEGSRLSSLGYMPFSGCYSLTAISIPESATACKTIDGVLYSGDGTTLLLYPGGKTDEAFTTPAGVTTIAESALYFAQFRTVTLSEGVITIGNEAFFGCNSMQSVSLPCTLTSIGDSAFANCFGLTTVTIPASVSSIGRNAFESCYGLTTVTIPASVTSIGSNAFASCYDLTTVNAPCNWDGSLYTFADTVTVNVPDHAFADGVCTGCGADCEHPGYEDSVCTQCGAICAHVFADGACTTCGLTGGYCGASTNEGGEQSVTWTLADNHLVISGEGAMVDYASSSWPWNDARETITDVTIGEGVTHIGKDAFCDFRSLTEITIPASVESIGYSAFGDSTVSSVTFAPNSRLTTIDGYAFSYLYSLKQITIPASVESIGKGAFASCGTLETVTFAEGSRLSSLGYMPFSSCYSLTAISIPESVTAYMTIDGVLYSGDGTTLLLYPAGKTDEAFTTPAGVTTIAELALYFAQFRTVILSEGVTTIGMSAFDGCSSMQSVSLPSTLTSIGDSAFANCGGLTTITIPASVSSIGENAFNFCSALTTVTIPASVTSIGDFAFNYCNNLTTVNAPCSWDGSLYTFADTVTVNVPNHAFADGKCTACGAVCEHPGYEDSVCTQCGAICTHTFSGGVCTTCGLTGGYCGASTNEGGEQNVIWTLADNHLVISGTGAMADSFYRDLPWWDSYQTITDVTIGEGVTRIGDYAFYNFQSLTEITIPASVESIGYQAFGNSTVSSVTFAPNSRLTTIDGYAFSYLRSLKQIILPASVESIGDSAFASCGALETVTFEEGSRLSSLGYKPFFCCTSLTAISIPESVTACKTIDGVLYSGDGTTLLLYPAGKTDEAFTTPAGVTTIAESALYYVQFRTVTLSEGVTTIGNDAFFGCNSMQSVSLPSTLTSIGSYAFANCDALTTVNAPCSWDGSLYTFADTVTVNAILHRGGTANCEQGAVCDDCGEVYTDLDPDNHTYASDICCGYCGAEGDVTNLTWTLKDGMLTISGTGAMEDYFVDVLGPWHDALDPITAVTIGNGVTHIGTWAFAYIDAETITFAANSQLTTIGYHAFEGSSLSEITIPASVETIGECAFRFCGNLSSVTFAEGSRLTSIGEECFDACPVLNAIIVPEDNTAYKTIDGVLYSGDGTTLIRYPAEKAGESFTTPAGVTTISDYAFKPNDSIRYLTLSEGVTTIGSYAVSFCYDLTTVTIPASVTSIGRDAFERCNNLTTVNVPCNWDGSLYTFADTVTVVVADHAFADGECTACGVTGGYCGASTNAGGVQSVVWTYRNGVLTITGEGAMADYEGGIGRPWHTWLTSLTSVYIGEGVETVSMYAFMGFTNLSSLNLAEGLKVIGDNAFAGCFMLETVVLPSSLTSIGGGAFFDCSGLTGVVIPEGVKTIGRSAFLRCTALTNVTLPASVTSIGEGAFEDCTALTTVNVPCAWMETPLHTFGGGVTLDYVPHEYDEGGVCDLCGYAAKASIARGADVLYFDTLPDALAAVEPEDKINVLADCDEDITIPSICEWYGSDFTCSGTVVNNSIIYEGVFTGHVTNSGSIVGGTFDGEVINQHMICGGTFNNAVTNDGHLSSGEFNGVLTNNATINNVADGGSWFTLGADFVLINNGTLTCESHIDPSVANCEHGEICRLCGEYGEPDPANHSYQSNTCCGVCGAEGDGTNVKWTLVDGVLTITGTGDMASYADETSRPWHSRAESITTLHIDEGVTSICEDAFHGFKKLTSVTIPASVKTMGGYAFYLCDVLESVTFAEGSQLTSIGDNAFSHCPKLTQITLPAGVTSIDMPHLMSESMTDVFVAEGNTTYRDIDGVLCSADGTTLLWYPRGRTAESYTTPEGVTAIGTSAFESNYTLKSITLPKGVTSIGVRAFQQCSSLETITLPTTVTSIHGSAFSRANALTTVNAPCNWDGSLFTFADTVTVNVPEHTGGTANCQSAAICEACGEAYGELDYDVHANTEVVWEWYPNDDSVSAYATLTCSDCGVALEVASGEGECLGVVEPTDCQHPGSTSYSATLTFEDGTVVTGTHTVTIPSENHVGPMNNGFCAACGSAEKPAVDPGEYEDETWDDIYLISNAGQLYWFANEVNGGNNGIGARLTANITVPASVSKGGSIPDWEPIGQGYTPYCGDFNGGGHTISGLYCVSSRAGLFGYTDYFYNIRNVGVVNGTFIGSEYAGALVGYASSTISGCWASGNTIEGNYAGGLVGQNIGTITGSRATGNTVEGSLAGGLVGYNNNGTIGRSYGTGNTVTGDSAGGLVGENYGTVENSYSTGNSTGYLVGYNGDPITNCYTDGSALFRDSYGDVTNSYYVAGAATDDGGRTAAQFASGEIAYLLQSAIEPEEVYDEETGEWVMADAPLVWGQSIGSASYPSLGGKRVYQVLSCDGEGKAYSNTDEPLEHSFTDSVCANCGLIGGFCGAEGDGTNIAWTLKDGTLTITGTGDMAEYDSYEDSPWYTYRNSITALTIQEGVTTIGGFAFPRTAGLKSVIIPATVKELGNNAFASCEALETVTFAEDSQLTTIGVRAFDNCSSLTEITLPEDVRAFDVDSVFGGCTALTNIFVAKNNKTYKDIDGVLYTADGTTLMYYPEGKAAESFNTPDGVTTIADDALYSNNYLKTVTVSEGVTSIGLWAFGHCGNLETVNLPDSLTSIGWYAFDCCYTLTTVTIPDGVESIGDNAFQYCTALTTVTIPVSVESIGTDAFLGCDALTTVNTPCNWDGSLYTFEDTVTVILADHSWTDGVCGGCGIACPHDTGNGSACSFCGTTVERSMVTLPASLTAIEAEAFTGTAAEAVVIPAGCTSIAAGAFSGCGSLEVIIFASADCAIAEGAIPSGVAIIAPAGGTVEAWTVENDATFLVR